MKPFPNATHWALLAGGLLFLLTFCLGSRGLNEPDEGRYASMALAMVRTGDWWEPRLSGYGHYDKPPLLYWTAAASLRVFGTNEWAARLPSLLGAIMALGGLGWAAARLHGARVAWWAVALCGTLVQFWTCARLLTPDMLLTGWCALAIGAWAECRHRGGAWRWWALSLGCWTLAWWTKATPTLVPMLGLAAGTWLTGDREGRRALRLPLLLPATLALGAPWFVSMVREHPDLREFFFGRELAGRLAGGAHRRGGPWFYYLGVNAIGWLPWWPLAAWAGWRQRRGAEGGRRKDETGGKSVGVPSATPHSAFRVPPSVSARLLGVEGWIVLVGLVIFSLNGSKLPTYTLVLAPWAALLMARPLASVSNSRPASIFAVGAFALVALPAAVLAPRFESRMGVNSSVREVCRGLQEKGAGLALFDRHWPGVEFYLPPGQGRFLAAGEALRQRASDPGPPTPTLVETRRWREIAGAVAATGGGPVWTVRYRKARKSPFTQMASQGDAGTTVVIGDFELRPFMDFPPPGGGATP